MNSFVDYIESLEERIIYLENLHKKQENNITDNGNKNKDFIIIDDDKNKKDENMNTTPIKRITRAREEINDELVFRGRGYLEIVEDNRYIMGGAEPRIYTKQDYYNVEASVDFMAVDNIGGKNWSGCSIGVRTDPEGHSGANPPMAHTYYFRLRKDMRLDLLKEIDHNEARIFLTRKDFNWKVNEWYNVMFKCYTTEQGHKLEGYINDELELEYLEQDDRMDTKGKVFIRNSSVDKARYENLIVKELELKKKELNTYNIVGYYPEWAIYNYKYFIKDLPKNIDILCYAFLLCNPTKKDMEDANLKYPPVPTHFDKPEGILIPHDEYAFEKNMRELRNVNKIKLFSLFGWTLSFNCSKIMRNDVLRKRLVDSCIEYVEKYDFDGIDCDWEYPNRAGRKQNNMDNQHNKEDGKYLLKFFMELKERKPDIILMAAIGTNEDIYTAYKGTEKYLDYVLLMLYDRKGKTWGDDYPYQADIRNDKIWIRKFKEICNFEDKQIIIGTPLYYRGKWKGQDKGTLNFGKAYNEDGLISIRDIEESDVIQIKHDLDYRACYIENDEWKYDGAWIGEKVKLSKSYGGLSVWNLADVKTKWFEENIKL